jgi:Zn-dependent metalloprotease
MLVMGIGLALCTGMTSPGRALVPFEGEDYEIQLVGDQFTPLHDMALQAELTSSSPEWQRFVGEMGPNWRAFYWSEANDIPHFFAGAPIALLTPGVYSQSEVSARGHEFLEEIGELIRVDSADLQFRSLTPVRGDRAYVFFDQFYRGLPVFAARLTLCFEHGGINGVNADVYPDIRLGTTPTLAEGQAAEFAHAGMPWNVADDTVTAVTLGVLPIVWDTDVGHFLVYRVRFETVDPPGEWIAYVDAHDGEVFWRENLVSYYAITGTARGDVQLRRADDPNQDLPMVDQKIMADGNTAYTDEDGEFEVDVANNQYYTVTDYNEGYFVRVYDNLDGEWTALTTSASPGDPAEFYWDDSNTYPCERSCYYHTNAVHSWLKGVDPYWTECDLPITCRVNLDCTCNAYYMGATINFCAEGGGCNNTGQIADVIYHEYHHWVTNRTYDYSPPPDWTGLNEGYSDYCAMALTNDYCMAPSFFQAYPDGCLRTGMNYRQYPAPECGGEPHCVGEITMGAMWKSRRNLTQKHGPEFAHQVDLYFRDACKATPNTVPNFLVYFLMANDDNGDLADGTPDYWEICDAWAEHNVHCPEITRKIVFTHTPLADTENTIDPILFAADISTEGGAGDIIPDSTKVFYSYDGVEYESVQLVNAGGGAYEGEIPASAGKLVDYYLRSVTTLGIVGTEPIRAPEKYTHRFLIGVVRDELSDDLEEDLGWTIGAPDDDATAGLWERVDPEGKEYGGEWVQPENDHTPDGTLCFVTDGRGGFYSNYDVDEGKTSVISPLLDLSATGDGYVDFHAFFCNFGPINDDSLMVFISPDGSDWTMLWEIHGEGYNDPDYIYYKIYFRRADHGGSATTQFKIVAEDTENNTITEAAIDDFTVWVTDAATVEGEESAPLTFWAQPASPSPFAHSTSIRFQIPARRHVDLRVFDVGGRLVRRLVNEELDGGVYAVEWDGCSDGGRAAASGIYYYSLVAGEREVTRKVVLTH